MNKKCEGCGAILQSVNEKNEGYIKKSVIDKASLCERCFKIKHYGQMSVISIMHDYNKMLDDIKDKNIIYLVDVLNINSDISKYIKTLKKGDIVLLTKRDVLPKSVKDAKLIKYFKDNYNSEVDVKVVSSKKKYNIDELLEAIRHKGLVYVIGLTNSGKSTLINSILESIGGKPSITVSAIPNTTTEYINIKIDDDLIIVDTPGFINSSSIYNYLNLEDVKKVIPKKEIKPKIMQTKSGFSVIVGNLLRIDNIGDNKANLAFYMTNNIDYEKVKITTKDNLKSLPKKVVLTSGEEDIVIKGLGFVKVTTSSKLVLYALDEGLIEIRPRMI